MHRRSDMPSVNRANASYILLLPWKACRQINVTCKDHLSVADGPSHVVKFARPSDICVSCAVDHCAQCSGTGDF